MSLPADAQAFMIHRPPLRLIERLLRVDADTAVAETVLPPGAVGLAPDGGVEAAALIELIAQAYAASQGYRDSESDRPPGIGYLVGASDVRIHRRPQAGERLRIEIRSCLAFEDFHTVEGRVYSAAVLLAEGTLKAWVQPRD
jgi:predicted hotdog family 3-hydroxylacyl-ACP dehydratase